MSVLKGRIFKKKKKDNNHDPNDDELSKWKKENNQSLDFEEHEKELWLVQQDR